MDIEEFKIAQKDSIAHYDRMIAFAEAEPPAYFVNACIMIAKIDECWGSEDCSFCQHLECDYCPLRGEVPPVEHNYSPNPTHYCCKNLHARLDNARTWGTWIMRAIEVREFIKNAENI